MAMYEVIKRIYPHDECYLNGRSFPPLRNTLGTTPDIVVKSNYDDTIILFEIKYCKRISELKALEYSFQLENAMRILEKKEKKYDTRVFARLVVDDNTEINDKALDYLLSRRISIVSARSLLRRARISKVFAGIYVKEPILRKFFKKFPRDYYIYIQLKTTRGIELAQVYNGKLHK